MTSNYQSKAVIAIMVLGVLALTVGADTIGEGPISAFIAMVGGFAATLGGVWGYRLSERRGDYDERYHQIALRGGAVSMWVFYWAVAVWSQVESNTEITTPILEPLTWLLAIPWIAFGLAYLYYTRIM
ncbi:hypothetical protein [Natranaeroarchaeum aerophilus]|uniref:Uncharacterized protein n=1 Tax=Natranaeroarchaeum aerophilus TaxID=2917711 RepID=A0AAE3FRZ9_9EURY|nr:hypothetical protein [Natranaeroarchaeum aerophilus]MCL9813828.1 hypothetical protein [Natranaeroarchaeum aerophilus]